MKFMVEFRAKPENKSKVLEAFEIKGPNRSDGVSFRDAWIGTQSEIIFVLAEGDDQAVVEKVCQAWSEHGEFQIHPVINIAQY